MEISNLIFWSLNQLKTGLWEYMRLLLGNTEVQNQWKYTLLAESSPFRCLYFRSISMAVLGNRYDSHEKTRKYKLQDKKPQLQSWTNFFGTLYFSPMHILRTSDASPLPPIQCWAQTGPLSALHAIFPLFPPDNNEWGGCRRTQNMC